MLYGQRRSVIGEKEDSGKKPGREPVPAERYCAKLKCFGNKLIINELLVEAAGVEPSILF
jgi:hypothetical protein